MNLEISIDVLSGEGYWSIDVRDDILLPQQLHWLVEAVSCNSAMFTIKAVTIPLTQRFCALLHLSGVAAEASAISAVRWDQRQEVYKIVTESL